MTLSLDWFEARINGTIVQIKDSIDTYTSDGDHPVACASIDTVVFRRILMALVKSSLIEVLGFLEKQANETLSPDVDNAANDLGKLIEKIP